LFAQPRAGYSLIMKVKLNAVLVGGPFDGTHYDDPEAALVELESGGLIHRYIATKTTRQVDDEERMVFQFDGTVAPDGGLPGTEDPRIRLASPLADKMRQEEEG
jgi:hypothetical protein